jgi:hypothetical protein
MAFPARFRQLGSFRRIRPSDAQFRHNSFSTLHLPLRATPGRIGFVSHVSPNPTAVVWPLTIHPRHRIPHHPQVPRGGSGRGIGRTFPSRVPSLTTARLLPREVRFMGRTPLQTAHRWLSGRTLTSAEPALFTSSSAGVRFLSFRTRRIAAPGRQRGCLRRFRGTRETSRPSP